MGNKWVILETTKEEFNWVGLKFKAFPLNDDSKLVETLEIVRDDEVIIKHKTLKKSTHY